MVREIHVIRAIPKFVFEQEDQALHLAQPESSGDWPDVSAGTRSSATDAG